MTALYALKEIVFTLKSEPGTVVLRFFNLLTLSTIYAKGNVGLSSCHVIESRFIFCCFGIQYSITNLLLKSLYDDV